LRPPPEGISARILGSAISVINALIFE
jgi:hypothetical protein